MCRALLRKLASNARCSTHELGRILLSSEKETKPNSIVTASNLKAMASSLDSFCFLWRTCREKSSKNYAGGTHVMHVMSGPIPGIAKGFSTTMATHHAPALIFKTTKTGNMILVWRLPLP